MALRLSADFSKALWWKRWGLGYKNCGAQADASKPCLRTTLMFGQNYLHTARHHCQTGTGE
jgi:hypothetical protein